MPDIQHESNAHSALHRITPGGQPSRHREVRSEAQGLRSRAEWSELVGHQRYLRNFARSRLGQDDEVEDLVQETLLVAFLNKAAFRGESTHRTWLTSVLMYKIADHCRRKGRTATVSIEQMEEDQPGWLDRMHTADAHMPPDVDDAIRSKVHAAVGRLPANQRDAWLLFECNEVPTATIQRILGVSANNVWVLLHRARKQLREELIGSKVGA